MPLTVTRAQRDAIYEMVINHLAGVGDVWIALQHGDLGNAKRLGRAFAEDLRLLEDLGWAETTDRETVMLTVPTEELTRAVARLHQDAAHSEPTRSSALAAPPAALDETPDADRPNARARSTSGRPILDGLVEAK